MIPKKAFKNIFVVFLLISRNFFEFVIHQWYLWKLLKTSSSSFFWFHVIFFEFITISVNSKSFQMRRRCLSSRSFFDQSDASIKMFHWKPCASISRNFFTDSSDILSWRRPKSIRSFESSTATAAKSDNISGDQDNRNVYKLNHETPFDGNSNFYNPVRPLGASKIV